MKKIFSSLFLYGIQFVQAPLFEMVFFPGIPSSFEVHEWTRNYRSDLDAGCVILSRGCVALLLPRLNFFFIDTSSSEVD